MNPTQINTEPQTTNDGDAPAINSPRRRRVRWAAAIGLTFALLPLPISRLLIGFHLQHYSIKAIVGLVVGIILVPLLTRRLTDQWSWNARLKLAAALALGWLVFSCIVTYIATSDTVPWYILGPAMGASTMWLLAVTWMWPVYPSSNGGLGVKLIVLAPLCLWAIGFWFVFGIDGLDGDAHVQFFWHSEAPEALSVEARVNGDTIANKINIADDSFLSYSGQDRHAHLTGRALSDDWATPPAELWRISVGKGWSGFVGTNEYVFTQELRGETECVVCYSLETGSEVWLHTDDAAFVSVLAGNGPRATPSLVMTTDADGNSQTRIVTVGATGLVNCLNASTGQSLWQVDLLAEHQAENLVHGVCASPLVVDGKVIVCPPGEDGPCIAAYELADGQLIWTGGAEQDRQSSYSSPLLAEIHGQQQIVLHAGPGVCGFDIETGHELWFFEWTNEYDNNAAQPLVGVTGANRIFASTGYGRGSALFEIADDGEAFETKSIWENRVLKSKYSSPIVHKDAVYGLDDGILSCVDAASGKRLWKRGRYGHGQVWLVGDLLLIQCEPGDLALVRPSRESLDEIARIPVFSAKTWNHLCLVGSKLLIRNDREAACLQLPVADSASP